MVAIKSFLPSQPDDRELTTSVLDAHPGLANFVVRFSEQILESRGDADISLNARQYDDWDPPLTVVIRESISPDQYVERFERIYDIARSTPGYDHNLVHISLRSTLDSPVP